MINESTRDFIDEVKGCLNSGASISGGSGADEVARAAIEAHAGNSSIHLTAEQLDSAVSAHNTNENAHTGMFAKSEHTHTVSDIEDFPEIPSAGVTEEQLSEAVEAHNTDVSAHSGMFAEPEHTHTVSEITDFPTSLPANGGNADTVGNVAVSSSDEVGLRKISAGTYDLTAGTSELETGTIHLVYE